MKEVNNFFLSLLVQEKKKEYNKSWADKTCVK